MGNIYYTNVKDFKSIKPEEVNDFYITESRILCRMKERQVNNQKYVLVKVVKITDTSWNEFRAKFLRKT